MVALNIGDIIGKITNIFKNIPIPGRKTEDEIPAENITEEAQAQGGTQVQEVGEVVNPFLEKQGIMSKLPIKKIMIIAPIIVIIGLIASGIIPINLGGNSQDMDDFNFINDRLTFVEDQIDYILDQGIGTGSAGEKGSPGQQGRQGIQGITGEQGRDGVGGIPLLFSSGSTKTQLVRPLYIGIGGGSEDYDLIKMITPADGTITNLHVYSSEPFFRDLSNNVYATLILNGEETELECTLKESKCSDTTTTIKIKSGDMFAIRIDKTEQILFGELFRIQASMIMEPDN